MPSRPRRVAIALAATAGIGLGAGCGTPSNFDHQEQVAFARACTSLIERNVVQANPQVRDLDGNELNLADPDAFYSTLQRLRGPDTFDFDDPQTLDRSPKDKLDDPCRPRTQSSSSSTKSSR